MHLPTPVFETSLRTWLLGLAVAAVLPFTLFSARLIVELGREGQNAQKASLIQQSELLARSVNDRFSQALGSLTALAEDEALQSGDLERAYLLAQRLLAESPDFRAIVLINRDESMAFFTALPFGAQLPPVSDLDSVRTVLSAGKRTLSRVFKSPVSERHVVALGVPVRRAGQIIYCLRLVFLVDSLSDVIRAQRLPADWIATTVDHSGTVATRTLNADRHVGKPASASVVAAIRDQREGLFERTTLEGIAVTTAVRPIGSWGWSVAVSVPDDALYGSLTDSLTELAAVGLLLLLSVVFLALRLSRALTRHASGVITVASGDATRPSAGRFRIAEVTAVQGHVNEQVSRRQQSEAALDTMSEKVRTASEQLKAAQIDPLTQLLRREAFTSEYERTFALRSEGDAAALLFIDLDNFKAVNDCMGHEFGDVVLRRVGNTIKTNLRADDLGARIGGDEFLVALLGPASIIATSARALAERLLPAIQSIHPELGASIGIALTEQSGESLVHLQKCADCAMYRAKRGGKNRYCFASECDDMLPMH